MSPGIDRRTIGDWNGAGAAAMGTSHVLTYGGGTFPLVGLSFVGLISTTPVFVGGDNLQFAAPNISYVMSNLAIQPFIASQAVPEPASWLLVGSALVGLAAWRSRQRKTGTA
jgi:hypothetical protein